MPDVIVNRCRTSEVKFFERLTVRDGQGRGRPQTLHIETCYTKVASEAVAPTHVLVALVGSLKVWDLAGNEVRTLTTLSRGGQVHVDYEEEKVYYAQENASGNSALWSVNFDGTDAVEIRDTGVSTGSGDHGVGYDPSRESFLISHSNRVFEVEKDGSSHQQYNLGITGHELAIGLNDDTHWLLFDDNALHLRLYPSSLSSTLTGTFIKGGLDYDAQKIAFGHPNNNNLEVCDFDFGNREGDLDTLDAVSVDGYALSVYDGWIYYTPTAGNLRRMRVSDTEDTEDLGTIPGDVKNVYAWWDEDYITLLDIGMVVNNTGHGATTNTKSALEGLGHTVTVVDEDDLDTHDFSGYDVVLVVRALATQQLCDDFKSNVIDEGIPVVIGNVFNGILVGTGNSVPSTKLSLTGTWECIANSAGGNENVISDNTHVITEDYSASEEITIYGTGNFMSALDAGESFVGSALAEGDPDETTVDQETLIAIPSGTNDLDGTPTTVKIVVWGDLYAGQSVYTHAGRSLLKRILDWVAS